jgi:hypothetical protein
VISRFPPPWLLARRRSGLGRSARQPSRWWRCKALRRRRRPDGAAPWSGRAPHPPAAQQGQALPGVYAWPPNTTGRHSAPTTFSTRDLAEQWLAEERRLIERGQWSPPKNRAAREAFRAQTFGDYAARLVDERRLKESSRKKYRRLLASFITDTLGPLPLDALDAATVRRLYAALDTTEHRKFKVYWILHSICATAVADGLLSPNPCQLNVVKPERLVKPVILEPDESLLQRTCLSRNTSEHRH